MSRTSLISRTFVSFIAVAATVLATYLADRNQSWQVTCYEHNNCDSLTFTVAAELLRDGQSPYLESVRRAHISQTRLDAVAPPFDLPFQYPPNALPLFAVRSTSSPRMVHLGIAFLTTLACLVLTIELTRRHLGDNWQRMLLVVSISFSGVTLFNAELGQTGALASVLVIGLTLSWQRWPLTAGVLLGILAFKPQYAGPILVVAVVRRDWRVVAGAVGSFAAFTVLSGLSYGFEQWAYFAVAARQPNHTVPWMVNWMAAALYVAPGHLESIHMAAVPVFVLGLAVLAGGLWQWRNRVRIEPQIAVATSWAVLFGPNVHPYDLLVLVPTLVYASRSGSRSRIGLVFLVISWCALPQPFRWVMTLALLALAIYCTHLQQREAESQPVGHWPLPSAPSLGA